MAEYRKDAERASPDVNEVSSYEKNPYTQQHVTPEGVRVHGIEYEEGKALHRGLKARHVTMIVSRTRPGAHIWLTSTRQLEVPLAPV
jgi:amino acid permease